jgi:hypothetical protein
VVTRLSWINGGNYRTAKLNSRRGVFGQPTNDSPKCILMTNDEDRAYTSKEQAKITAGAVAAIVIVGLLVVIALAFLWTPPS